MHVSFIFPVGNKSAREKNLKSDSQTERENAKPKHREAEKREVSLVRALFLFLVTHSLDR